MERLEAFGQQVAVGALGTGDRELAGTFAVHLLDGVLQRGPDLAEIAERLGELADAR